MDLPATPGRHAARWINIATGEWGRREMITGGALATLTAPAMGHWVAGVVKE